MLYQLSYARIHAANSALMRYVTLPVFIFVPAAGLEPTTSTVSEWRSHQLNHTGKDENKIVEGRPHNTAITCRFCVVSERTSRVKRPLKHPHDSASSSPTENRRCKLPDGNLQDSLAAIRSKSHTAFAAAWFALHRDSRNIH